MRISPVLPAIVVTVIAAVYGCSLPLEGLPAGAGGAGGADGAGGTTSATATGDVTGSSTGVIAVTCNVDSDCGTQTPCASFVCMDGKCLQSTTPDDMPVGTNMPGDCQKTICMSGKQVTLPDPGDVGDDQNPCTVDTCDEKGSTHVPQPNGNDCGSGNHCFDSQCVQCENADQCPKDSNACIIATCFNNQCGTAMDMDGTHCADAKDCKSEGQCNNGACVQPNKSEGASCEVLGFSGVCKKGSCCATTICNNVCCILGQHCGMNGKCTY